jgi:hypothetical protein
MARKKLLAFFLVLVAMYLYRNFRDQHEPKNNSPRESVEPVKNTSEEAYVKALRSKPLDYTQHALCRMGCRNIDESEVKEILQEGSINWDKTELKDQPCPSFALEGTTQDGQEVRIVFAGCEDKTRVITAIDLDTEWKCDCY